MAVPIENLYAIYLKHPLISTDSRKIGKGSLFFALRGDRFNGNEYAKQALANGASYAVVDDPGVVESEQYFLVRDVLGTLQQLASHHRDQLTASVLCITGTNGKTTTKELVARVLGKKYVVSSTKGNFNNHLGVPLSILAIGPDTEIAIIELGANHPHEIAFLCEIAKPNYGLITNVGKAHLEGFRDLEGVIDTKAELYAYLKKTDGRVFVNGDNETLLKRSNGMNRTLYGTSGGCYCVGSLRQSEKYLQISYHLNNDSKGESVINSRLIGAYNFENVLAAICTGAFFKVPENEIVDAVETYIPVNSRSQEIETDRNRVIMDAYNANPMNMRAALDSFMLLAKSNRMVVLGDMLELGRYSAEEHRTIAEFLSTQSIDKLILVGENFSKVSELLKCEHFDTTQEAAAWLKTSPPAGMNILLKGSRGIGLEALLPML